MQSRLPAFGHRTGGPGAGRSVGNVGGAPMRGAVTSCSISPGSKLDGLWSRRVGERGATVSTRYSLRPWWAMTLSAWSLSNRFIIGGERAEARLSRFNALPARVLGLLHRG